MTVKATKTNRRISPTTRVTKLRIILFVFIIFTNYHHNWLIVLELTISIIVQLL